MATATQDHKETTPVALVSGIIGDAQSLVKHQLELFRVELRQDMEKAREGGWLFALGAGLCLVGLVVLVLALAHLLAYYVPTVPLWGWYALAGGAVVLIGVSLVGMVAVRLRHAEPLSETAAGLEENAEWKTNPK